MARLWTHVDFRNLECKWCNAQTRDVCRHIITECVAIEPERRLILKFLEENYHRDVIIMFLNNSEMLLQVMLGSLKYVTRFDKYYYQNATSVFMPFITKVLKTYTKRFGNNIF